MKKRIALFSTLVLSLILMPGCPGAGNPAVGDWFITWANQTVGIELKANGETETYAGPQLLGGTFTWESDGTRVVLHQVFGNDKTVWTAELTSDTTMSGAWITWAGNIGTTDEWSAFKI